MPLPYHHSNIQSEEVMFYAEGDYAARKGVDVGCITLHPSGLPHGPQPGAVEKALGSKSTDELAVMWDTFRPLRLTTLWRDHDKPEYALSWYEEPASIERHARGRDQPHLAHFVAGVLVVRDAAHHRYDERGLVGVVGEAVPLVPGDEHEVALVERHRIALGEVLA